MHCREEGPGRAAGQECVTGVGGEREPLICTGAESLASWLSRDSVPLPISPSTCRGLQWLGRGSCRLRPWSADEPTGHGPFILPPLPGAGCHAGALPISAYSSGHRAGLLRTAELATRTGCPQSAAVGQGGGSCGRRGEGGLKRGFRGFWRFTVKWWVFPGPCSAASVPDVPARPPPRLPAGRQPDLSRRVPPHASSCPAGPLPSPLLSLILFFSAS